MPSDGMATLAPKFKGPTGPTKCMRLWSDSDGTTDQLSHLMPVHCETQGSLFESTRNKCG